MSRYQICLLLSTRIVIFQHRSHVHCKNSGSALQDGASVRLGIELSCSHPANFNNGKNSLETALNMENTWLSHGWGCFPAPVAMRGNSGDTGGRIIVCKAPACNTHGHALLCLCLLPSLSDTQESLHCQRHSSPTRLSMFCN